MTTSQSSPVQIDDHQPPLSAPLRLSFDYTRSVGPTLSKFFTALRERRIVGVRGSDGRVPTPPARQLSACADGDLGTVARISDADPEMLRYFDAVGISLDSRLQVLARRDFAGMISVSVQSSDGGLSTIELGSPAAQAIWVVAP